MAGPWSTGAHAPEPMSPLLAPESATCACERAQNSVAERAADRSAGSNAGLATLRRLKRPEEHHDPAESAVCGSLDDIDPVQQQSPLPVR